MYEENESGEEELNEGGDNRMMLLADDENLDRSSESNSYSHIKSILKNKKDKAEQQELRKPSFSSDVHAKNAYDSHMMSTMQLVSSPNLVGQ